MIQTKTNENGKLTLEQIQQRVAHAMAQYGGRDDFSVGEEQAMALLRRCAQALGNDDMRMLMELTVNTITNAVAQLRPDVTEVRPQELECDVVRFQNNKEKWVALVGLLNGYPYEIFTGLQDDDEGIMLPKSVTKGRIIKQANADGSKRYDFQFTNTRGYKITVEGLSEKFNPEYWNYAKLISGVLRYRMPIDHVLKLVSSLSLKDESINTWKNGVERALKRYLPGHTENDDESGTDA